MTSANLTTNLPGTDLTLSTVGIGTWAWGDQFFWSYGRDYDSTQLRQAFDAALDHGINWFDTAEVYGFGESELLLGQFIKHSDRPVLVASKYMPLPWRFSPQSVIDAIDCSLERLRIDCIDIYQVHAPFSFLLSQESLMTTLASQVKVGKIKALGVSNYSAAQMTEAHNYLANQGIPLAVNQVRYSLLARQIETNGIQATAQKLGITILAYSPLAQGLLTGKYSPDNYTTPQGARRWNYNFSPQGLAKIAPVLDLLQNIGKQYDRTPAQVALNWLICQGAIPIAGAKNAQQAQDNALAMGWSLDSQDLAKLNQATLAWR